MMTLYFRRLRHHWLLSLGLLLYLALAVALVAGLSGAAAAISARELNRNLEQAGPAERTLLITGTRYTFRDALYEDLKESLGDLLEARLVIRHATLPADPRPSGVKAGTAPDIARLDVYSFDRLPENVRIVEGRLPADVRMAEAVGNWPPAMEAVIGATAAGQTGYQVGDRVTASSLYHRLDIVGVVEPLNPEDDLWGGDLGAFAADWDGHGPSASEAALPLIIAPASMQSYLESPVFPHEVSWRITLDSLAIGPEIVEKLHSELTSFQTRSATMGAKTGSGLLQILLETHHRLSRLRVVWWVLASQTLILVVYALLVFASLLAERAQLEIGTLSARGLSAWQIARGFALEVLGLAVAASFLGLGLAKLAVHLWGAYAGMALPARTSHETWLLPALAVGASWLALVAPVAVASWRGARATQPARARPAQQLGLHKRYVDLYLLAFGGLLVWQLGRSGSLLGRILAGSPLAQVPWLDPLLLLGPFLLLVAMTLIFLRFVPFLSGLAARLFQGRRGLVLPLGLWHPARDPRPPSRIVLLVSLATGLALFAMVLSHLLAQGRGRMGSDRLVQDAAGLCQFHALGLVLFGVMAFFLLQLGDAGGRLREAGILRALGLPARQWPALYFVEGIWVVSLGLLAGAFMGLALSSMMVPYLSHATLAARPVSPAGLPAMGMVIDLRAVARLYAVLAAGYVLALAVLWFVLARRRVLRAPWFDDE